MKIVRIFILIVLFTLLFGCSDDAMVNIFNKSIKERKIECMRLVVFHPDKEIENTLNELYKFSEDCSLKLELSKKEGITCNSNQNLDKKVLSKFPESYLRMVLKEGNSLVYSYYIDLEEDVKVEDIKKAFNRINKDLNF